MQRSIHLFRHVNPTPIGRNLLAPPVRHASTHHPPPRITGHHPPTTIPSRARQSTPHPAKPTEEPPFFSPSRPRTWVFAAAIAFFGLYTTQLVLAASKPCTNPGIRDLSAQKDVASRYDQTADSFDSEVGFSEWLTGINSLRQRLAGMCKGHVLEVSCGTGRNLGYFDVYRDHREVGDGVGGRVMRWFTGVSMAEEGKVRSLTFVDLSPGMVEVARRKWEVLFGGEGKRGGLRGGLVVRFLGASALGRLPAAPETGDGDGNGKYETIIQTMGLCSTPQPVELLTNLARYLDSSNPESRILLLEHGRSYQGWLNNILDGAAEKHAELHGCWFNRDIGALVQEAAEKSGLEVVRERRHHLGTTWLFELKATPQAAEIARRKEEEYKLNVVEVEKRATKGWFSWPWTTT